MFAFIIPHCPLSVKQKAKKLYQGSLAAPSGGGASHSPRCPLWGWCVAQPSLPPLGVVLRAANQDSNDCRWQSYLCFVPRSGKGGAVGNFELFPFNEQHPLSLALLDSSPIGEPSLTSPERGGGPRVSVAEGFAVRRMPFEMRQGESVQATWLPHRGAKDAPHRHRFCSQSVS